MKRMEENNNTEFNSEEQNLAKLISFINLKEQLRSTEEAGEAKQAIYRKLDDKIAEAEKSSKRKYLQTSLYRTFAKIACAIAVVAVCSTLFYQVGKQSNVDATWIEIKTPLGTVANFTLPDSTRVVLNGGSTIRYPSSFDKERHVDLAGEAYFDVAKDENKPMVVHTQNLETRVLGTKFNILAYPEDEATFLTLVEGSVMGKMKQSKSLNEIIKLSPNQQLKVNNTTNEIWKQNVVAAECTLWIDGVLSIKGMTMKEIIPLLQRQFNVTILMENEIPIQGKYYAKFENDETIDQVLELLCHRRNWKYTKNKTIYRIYN